jgi:hypothetical protein
VRNLDVLTQFYRLTGILLILGFAMSEALGWEFGNPNHVRNSPPVGAALTSSRSTFWGPRLYYRDPSVSYGYGTRGGSSFGGFGGK